MEFCYNKSIIMQIRMFKKYILIILISSLLFSCNNKKENIKKLFNVEDNIDLALKSQDSLFVEEVINQITVMEKIFPEHQSLKEKKYTLQIRLRKYNDAISTIDSLIVLSPNDIDNRIVQGILFEINGDIHQSISVLEKALELIDLKIDKMLQGDQTKKLGRDINRIMILKLLNRDSQLEYDIVKNDPNIDDYPNLLALIELLEKGSREQIINRYR